MAAHNRNLRGNTKQIKGPVQGAYVIEPGYLVGVNITDGWYGTAGKTLMKQQDGYIYPLNACRPGIGAASPAAVLDNSILHSFAGIALTGSAAGVTNEIVVAIDGIVRFPIVMGPSAVTIGSRVSAVSGTGSTGTSNEAVAANADADKAGSNGTTGYLGIIVKTESGASFVDFKLHPGLFNRPLL